MEGHDSLREVFTVVVRKVFPDDHCGPADKSDNIANTINMLT